MSFARSVEQETAHLDRLHLTVALSYGGRTEIVDAVRELLHEAQDGKLQPDDEMSRVSSNISTPMSCPIQTC